MAKTKKKRNKAYTGAGAATTKPTVAHVAAVKRNPVHQYWVDHKRFAKPVAITAGIVIVLIVVIVELIRLATGNI